MSGGKPGGEPPAGRSGPPASRAGFRTMPTELRVFQQVDPHAGALASKEVASAAEELREAGRGPDVLYEDVRAEPPQAPGEGPSPDENRAEHVIVTMPGGASPWAKDGAAAKELAAAAIDKGALPSATAAGRPSETAGTLDEATAAAIDKRADKGAAAASVKPRPTGGDRRFLTVAGLLVAALLVFALVRGWSSPGEPSASGSGDTGSGRGLQAMGTGEPLGTGAPMPTGGTMTGAGGTGAAMTTGAPAMTETPYGSGTSQAPAVGTGTRAVPKGTGDPYGTGDAGAAPKASVTPPTTASVEPTSAPVVTAVPSVTPAVTTAAPKASSDRWFQKDQ